MMTKEFIFMWKIMIACKHVRSFKSLGPFYCFWVFNNENNENGLKKKRPTSYDVRHY